MSARLSTLMVALGLSLAAGCGPRCDQSSLCAVVGTGDNIQVCDGKDYKSCGDDNRGQTVPCVHQQQIAECTTTGWTFLPAAPGGAQ